MLSFDSSEKRTALIFKRVKLVLVETLQNRIGASPKSQRCFMNILVVLLLSCCHIFVMVGTLMYQYL